jgi:Sugar (and other) transporter
MARVNRRPLVIMSCLVSGCFLFVLTLFFRFIEASSWTPFACVAAIFGYIIFYQLGLGPIPYFIGAGACLYGKQTQQESYRSVLTIFRTVPGRSSSSRHVDWFDRLLERQLFGGHDLPNVVVALGRLGVSTIHRCLLRLDPAAQSLLARNAWP